MTRIDDIIKKYSCQYISDNISVFQNNFLSYMLHEKENLNFNRFEEILDGFFNDKIEILKSSKFLPKVDSPILICLVKNDLQRMKRFFEYYRRLGVEKFAIIDNDSDIDTRKYFLAQDDADVFLIEHPFSSPRHVSWLNKVLCHYGFNRWYLSVDSDEFLDYIGSEQITIQNIVSEMEKKDLQRVLAVQIDFYAKANLFHFLGNNLPWDRLKYFDTDSYDINYSSRGKLVVGGPRKRILNTYSVLTKYPLFYLRPEDINVSVHFPYPYDENFKSPYLLVLKHYEFINEEDKFKFKRIIHDENYASGSKEYKEMNATLQKKQQVSFWSESSALYKSSEDLRKLPFLSSIND